MKEELFKINFEIYENIEFESSTPIDYCVKYSPNKKNPIFIHKHADNTKELYIENYGNKLFSINKSYCMIVVEKNEDKVSIKLFTGSRNRREGKNWFNVSKNIVYITANIKTGDVYHGYLNNYNKKKCSKQLRRNYFVGDPINYLKMIIKENLSRFVEIKNPYEITIEAISTFMYQLDKRKDFENYDFTKRLFKFYLDKRGVKYPNNFYVYMRQWKGVQLKKTLKKQNNRMVDTIMIHNGLSGSKIKKALHVCERLNIPTYLMAKNLFGEEWLNQDNDIILKCLNYNIVGNYNYDFNNFKDLVSVEELRRVFQLFKKVFIDNTLDSYTFFDHIRFYCELKNYGEHDLRWYSHEDKEFFMKEHLDWTEKLDFYKNGTYTRIYPEYMYEMISDPITDENNTYYPVLLDNTLSYNEESSNQSNCVKTYIGKSYSIIISFRKNGVNSDERATIEYNLIKEISKDIPINIKRGQTLGKYNSSLSREWDEVLLKLDKQILSCIRDKRFETVKLKKECKNGVILNSDSYWDDNGMVRWSYNEINGNMNNVIPFVDLLNNLNFF